MRVLQYTPSKNFTYKNYLMMFYQKLSQALGQLKKGFCYDSPLGKIPTYEYLKPITASATAVLPAITLATGATTTIDQNRKQQTTVTISGTWAADDEANVTVSGTEVEFIALGSDTDDIAEGLAEAINDDETVSALVTAVAVGSVVTLTSVVI
jgi:hypothetical protein